MFYVDGYFRLNFLKQNKLSFMIFCLKFLSNNFFESKNVGGLLYQNNDTVEKGKIVS